MKKIYILPIESLADWNDANETDFCESDLDNEQFVDACTKYGGWTLDSPEALVDALNTDSPYAPVPSSHYVRMIEVEQ